MTANEDADVPGDVAGAFDRHDAFERDGDAYHLDSTAFDVTATAAATADEKAGTFTVTVPVPTLSASVADPDDVAQVVEDGWFETFERRLEDAFDVAKTSYGDDPVLDRDPDVVTVTLSYESWSAREGVEDAKVLAEYVEGTFVQGLIPGYDYVGAAATLRSNATQNAGGSDGDDASGADRSGTPL
jgi:hypothetical protein